MLEKATYEDFCVWLRCVSDNEPTRERYSVQTVGDLQAIKSEADRIRRITAQYEASQAKAKAAAARVK
ncbi:MAG: hypothetical protein GY878_23055 [Fuerstiella sp.]|nr:hypothetical protein [Fuerstiella sp.]